MSLETDNKEDGMLNRGHSTNSDRTAALRITKGTTTLPLLIDDYRGRSIVFAASWFAAPAAKK